MTAEEQAAATARYSADTEFLRSVGLALEAEAVRRRATGEDALDNTSAAAFVAALPAQGA